MDMDDLTIEIIQPEDVRSLRARTGDGRMAETFSCDVVWADGTQQRAFIKCFPECRKLGVVNEITGYLIAKSCSLPVPSKAGVIRLNDELIAALSIEVCTRVYIYAFVISESPGESPNSLYPNLSVHARARLARQVLQGWHALCPLIAFDDWAANPDRNLGNFLIYGDGKINIIDHSNMPVDVAWTPADLDVGKTYPNQIVNILTFDQKFPFEAAFVIKAAESHAAVYNKVEAELEFWWDAFLGSDQERRQAIGDFLKQRADSGKDRISQNLLEMPV